MTKKAVEITEESVKNKIIRMIESNVSVDDENYKKMVEDIEHYDPSALSVSDIDVVLPNMDLGSDVDAGVDFSSLISEYVSKMEVPENVKKDVLLELLMKLFLKAQYNLTGGDLE